MEARLTSITRLSLQEGIFRRLLDETLLELVNTIMTLENYQRQRWLMKKEDRITLSIRAGSSSNLKARRNWRKSCKAKFSHKFRPHFYDEGFQEKLKREGNRSFSKDERFKYHVVEEELKERSPGPTTAEHKPLLYKNVSALSILPSIRSRSSKS